ncbi:MAG: hypothetical protein WEB52_10375 [Dehalococcoidia bacterium]
MGHERLKRYESNLVELRMKLIRTLGIDAVDVVMRRAIAEVSNSYPALSLIRCVDEQVVFDGTEAALAGAADDQIDAAFEALNSVMLLVIARILGREIASRLAEGVEAHHLMKGIPHDGP